MKKEREETRTHIVEDYYCDECGEPSRNVWGHPYVCHICGRHFCDKHIHRQYDPWGGDSVDYYCYSCWDIGEKYRKEIEEIELEYDNKKEQKEKEWHFEAIEVLKKEKKI